MRCLLIVVIHRVDCRKNNFAGRTATNPIFSHVVERLEGEGEKIQFSARTRISNQGQRNANWPKM